MLKLRIKNVLVPMMMVAFLLISSSFAQDESTRGTQTDTGKTQTTTPGYDTRTQPQTQTQGNQMYKQNAERWTQSLNTRLNLTSDQQTRINSILMDYQTRHNQLGTTSNPQTLQDDVNRQIEGVLDNNQRTNWDAYSTTWWSEINRGMGTGSQMNKTSPNNNSDYDENSRYNEKSDTSRTSGDKDIK